jgi:hypothetical protein
VDKSGWSEKKSKIVNHNNFEALNVFLAEAAENGNDNCLEPKQVSTKVRSCGRRLFRPHFGNRIVTGLSPDNDSGSPNFRVG